VASLFGLLIIVILMAVVWPLAAAIFVIFAALVMLVFVLTMIGSLIGYFTGKRLDKEPKTSLEIYREMEERGSDIVIGERPCSCDYMGGLCNQHMQEVEDEAYALMEKRKTENSNPSP
jgi:hypothetical protein